MKTIVDISVHQKDIKIADLKGVDGVIYRISIGTSKLDDSFKNFVAQKNDPLGVYVASYAKNAREAKAEAEYAIAACKKYGIIYYYRKGEKRLTPETDKAILINRAQQPELGI